jgi:hypothetical protein
MNSPFFFLFFFYFLLDNFFLTVEGDDYGWGEWEEGKTALVCAVFGRKRSHTEFVTIDLECYQ